MARELRRLLIPPERLAPRITLEAEERHYVARVLRFRCGDRLAVIDGAGRLWSACLDGEEGLLLEQPLERPLEQAPPPGLRLNLAMAVPKRDAELVWRMGVELGASCLQPLIASRGVVRQGLPLHRWRAIVREATEQCERLWLPELAEPQTTETWFAAPPPGLGLLACPRHGVVTSLADVQAQADGSLASEVTLAIGPEGGWSPEEEAMALAAGWRPLHLGPTILRTSTAAVAGLALLALGPGAGLSS
jgi:16S rRNA (uracil1498-N3)-methyltransferase